MKYVEDNKLSDFFTDQLMNQVTDFRNFSDFLKASGFNATTAEEFDDLPQIEERDKFVAKHSQFSSWNEMVKYFGGRYYGN